jgi:hypothetical protein
LGELILDLALGPAVERMLVEGALHERRRRLGAVVDLVLVVAARFFVRGGGVLGERGGVARQQGARVARRRGESRFGRR